MEIVFRETVRVLKEGQRCVLATVVRTKGSTPQKSGAKLLVRQDGSGVGTLGGGCVEGDIWFAAKTLLKEGGPAEMRDYYLNEELAARDGLVCGGTMYFLIDPIYEPEPTLSYSQAIVEAYQGRRSVALASLTRAPQGFPTRAGATLFVQEDGASEGTLGDQALDQRVARKARALMPYGKCDYLQTQDGAEVFIEAYTTPPQLVLMGGGHVSRAIAPLAKTLGFRIFVIDDRPEFANEARFPQAKETIVAPYDKGLDRVAVNSNTFIVIATRGHRYDDMATEAAARSPASYVGLLGSKRKSLLIFEELFRKEVPEERIRTIRSPVGLSIGARTPEEIAVSIMAEILAVRLGGDGSPMRMEERLFLKAKEKSLAPTGR
ncbi:MAG: XdhC family protein [Chloroflexi bacterium]|nr:XdhC family protein [Chloroflexota bacterium]